MIDVPTSAWDTEPATAPYIREEGDSTPDASVIDQWLAGHQERLVIDGDGTTCFVYYQPFFERDPWWSDTLLTESSIQEAELEAASDLADSVAIETRDKRLVLLARKYAAKEFPDEDKARLEIVTERLRKMFPRVEAADFEQLERIAHDVESAEEKRLAFRRKLDLDQ